MQDRPAAGRVAVILAVLALLLWPLPSSAGASRVLLPLPQDKKPLPAFVFVPQQGVNHPIPGVVVAVGVGGQMIPHYHEYCQLLANRGFAVILIDPSNYPEELVPGPYSWDRGLGYIRGSINQGVVAGRLFFGLDWYLEGMKAGVDFLCNWPLVDRHRIAISGFSQPANAALTYACKDPRIKSVVWNYGGSPWVMPYDPWRLPPVQIFHGEKDEVYDVKYARRLALNLMSNMRYYELNIYPGEKHMFNVYYDARRGENRFMKPALLDAFERLVRFLGNTLAVPCR
ncbi:MAG: dienelactone hydrolase family protein [Desulfomonilaceae bacterium]|nr:dienelactone hydrolase family protein [Desulfomonilaceae bacterium]